MTAGPSYAALRAHNDRVQRMLADPECVGDLLLVGLFFARCVDLGDPPMDTVVKEAAKAVYGNAVHPSQLHGWGRRGTWLPSASFGGTARVCDVLRSDIRRYTADLSRAYRCQRPIRRSAARVDRVGEVCGRHAVYGTRKLFTDPVDGTRHALGACGRDRCRAWWDALRETNQREIEANPPPEPVANRGGVLERHLDEIDWWAIYRHLDDTWTPPHEAPGWRPPKLQLVLTDEPVAVTAAGRPALTVVKGGWR